MIKGLRLGYSSRLIVLFISLLLAGCERDSFTTDVEVPQPSGGETPDSILHYLALGDSYTIGEGVAERERYPVQLAESLRSRGIDVASPTIIARTGWRTDDLQQAIRRAELRSRYDLVSLLIGVNNQFQGRPQSVYRKEFRELLTTAIQLAGGDTSRVFVVSIPDYAYTPFGGGSARVSREIDEFNAINQAITADFGVRYFNITPISRQGLQQPELVARDGLHPSGEQYRRWVELIEPVIAAELKN